MTWGRMVSIFIVFSLAGCASNEGGFDSAPKFEWPQAKGRVSIKDTIIISGIKNYSMKEVDGSALDGTGDQSESQEAPFELRNGGKLQEAIARSWPESIHIRGDDCVVENVYIPSVGEDAVTVFAGSDNVIIRNCAFAKAEDKALQINGGGNILIEKCYFNGFRSAIRIKKGTGKVTVKNCTFVSGTGAVVLDAGVSTPSMSNNTFYDVKYEVRKD